MEQLGKSAPFFCSHCLLFKTELHKLVKFDYAC